MSFLKSSGPMESVKDILQLNRPAGIALVNYHSAVLRQESELIVRDRELIAAYVSGLNACQYCFGVHGETAKAFGIEENLILSLLQNIETALIEPRMKPVLAYVKQLTLEPSKMTEELAENVFAAGWSDQALHDAINVCALFNFMNRLVEGHRITGNPTLFEDRGRALHEQGYDPLLKFLEEK
jgi:uncharacterized peroxidase-related enzyme